jgi:hypothetical protein
VRQYKKSANLTAVFGLALAAGAIFLALVILHLPKQLNTQQLL